MPYVPPHKRPREETRYKAVVILRVGNKFIVVRDKKSQDLTFIVGGCKKNESSRNCAIRELLEETKRGINTNRLQINHNPTFVFTSTNRSNSEKRKNKTEGVSVTMQYNVFVVDVTQPFNTIKQIYNSSKLSNREFAETNGILLLTKEEMRPRLWSFMRNNILTKCNHLRKC